MSFLMLDEWMALVRRQMRKMSLLREAMIGNASAHALERGVTARWSLTMEGKGRLRFECHRVGVVTDPDEFLPGDIHPGQDWIRDSKLWVAVSGEGQVTNEIIANDEEQVRYRPMGHPLNPEGGCLLMSMTVWVDQNVINQYLNGTIPQEDLIA